MANQLDSTRLTLAAARGANYQLIRDCILIWLLTGEALKSVISMQWRDINYHSHVWRLTFPPRKKPKEVHLSPLAMAIVWRMRQKARCPWPTYPWIFPASPRDLEPIDINEVWETIPREVRGDSKNKGRAAIIIDWNAVDDDVTSEIAGIFPLNDLKDAAIYLAECCSRQHRVNEFAERVLCASNIIDGPISDFDDEEWVDESVAASLAGLSLSWFRQLRCYKKGPPFLREWGYVYKYKPSMIRAWLRYRHG